MSRLSEFDGVRVVRAPGGHPSLRPPVVQARTAESLTRLYRESSAIVCALAAGPDGGRRRALASSSGQLQRAFEEVGETSFNAYLREVRLRHEARLLVTQPLTVREVSLLVGSRQPAHFAKAFRRRYGVTRSATATALATHRPAPAAGDGRRACAPLRVEQEAHVVRANRDLGIERFARWPS